ncbi:MAG: hypothetical protein QF578_20865 [Alphaproteobacteria bacterium]|jgi:hypothetical protein|nr:hypothetical protein [Alphaproteobacteria bacterium]MDP6567294.1 hypothetical protein [Alphaproteobacteria bacterium]MDP6814953.1 hypothetical protein [Alphaproteobacteria bacterium]
MRQAQAIERRATVQANRFWQEARAKHNVPALGSLKVGSPTGSWRNRFLLRCDRRLPQSVFIVCGRNVQQDFGVDRLGSTLEDTLPPTLRDGVIRSCQRSIDGSCPIEMEGSYGVSDAARVVYRSIFMPVRAMANDSGYIFGAYSCKQAA